MAAEICERVRGSQATELRDRAQSAGDLQPNAEAKGIGRPSRDQSKWLEHRNADATDRLLELLTEHHPADLEWCKYSSRQPAKPVPENHAPSDTASDGLALKLIAEPEACVAPDPDDLPETLRYPRIEEIQRAAALHYNVSRHDIISSRRTANVVRPRQVAMYLAKTLTLRSLPDIGRMFGNRDHTTCLHAIRKIANLIPSDARLAADVETIRIATLRIVAASAVLT